MFSDNLKGDSNAIVLPTVDILFYLLVFKMICLIQWQLSNIKKLQWVHF